MKTCVRCKIEKPLSEYHKYPRSADGLNYACKTCRNKQGSEYKRGPGKAVAAKWKVDNPENVLLFAARKRAKRDGLTCTITADDIVIPSHCPILGIELATGAAGTRQPRPNAPSIDKIKPELGYVPGNVQVISHKANAMKNNASPKELQAFAKWVTSHF